MRTRKEAAEYFNSGQLQKDMADKGGNAWHIGRMEIKRLLDFIYEQEPQCKEEEIDEWKYGKNS